MIQLGGLNRTVCRVAVADGLLTRAEVRTTIDSRGHLLRGPVRKPGLAQLEGSSRGRLLHHITALNFAGHNFWLGEPGEFDGNYVRAEMVEAFITSDE